MSFVVIQAETFNYRTNYEVVNVSHLTQPTPKQNRTFSGGDREERGSKGTKMGKMTLDIIKLYPSVYPYTKLCFCVFACVSIRKEDVSV